MTFDRLLPYGVKDYYPSEAEKLERFFRKLEGELSLWGYSPIKLPHLEYKELFERTLSRVEGIFTFPEYGRELALRYDFTPQLLRFVLHQKRRLFPYRVYYKGETFRKDRQLWEESSVGFELVGGEGTEADAEILALSATLLKKVGLKDFALIVGHRKIYDLLSEKFGQQWVDLKRFSKETKPFLRTYRKENLRRLAEVGVPKEVLEEIAELFEFVKNYAQMEPLFLPSLNPERDYYSGFFFKVISPSGEVLAKGGRYDRLFERFGKSISATGGAISLTKLLKEISKREEGPPKVYIVDLSDEGKGWNLAKLLREKGVVAARDTVKREPSRSLSVAEEKGYDLLLVVDGDLPFEGKVFKTDLGKLLSVPLTEKGKKLEKRLEEIFLR